MTKDIIISFNSEREFLDTLKTGSAAVYSKNDIPVDSKSQCYIVAENMLCGKVRITGKVKYRDEYAYIMSNDYVAYNMFSRMKFENFTGVREFDFNRYFKERASIRNNSVNMFGLRHMNESIPGCDPAKYPENKYLFEGFSADEVPYLLLLENRSLVTYKDRFEIDKMLQYVQKYVNGHMRDLMVDCILDFTLDDVIREIGNVSFSFCPEVDIRFSTTPADDMFTASYGESTVRFDENDNPVYVRFDVLYSEDIFSGKKEIVNNMLSSVIEHEFHHFLSDMMVYKEQKQRLYDLSSRVVNVEMVNNVIGYHKRNGDVEDEPEVSGNEYRLAFLLYNLFVVTENTAHASEIYGELKYNRTDIKNLYSDISKTRAWKNYHTLDLRLRRYEKPSVYIPPTDLRNPDDYIENKDWDPEWEWCKTARDYFTKPFKDDEQFRKWFLRYARRSLNIMMRTMFRQALMSYEDEFPEVGNARSIKE